MSAQHTPPHTAAGDPAHPGDDSYNTNFAPYLPHDLEYGASFEDAVMDMVLNDDAQSGQHGIRIIPEDSMETPIAGVSVRAEDVTFESLPVIGQHELPLPLDDPRRVFSSPISGIKLTHPGGYLEGGPGLDPEMDTFPDDFFSNNPRVQNNEELRTAKQLEIDQNMELLRERLGARRHAIEQNEKIQKELKSLMDQRETELKVQQRVADEIRARKEAKARKMKQNQGS
ncbi:hypothetical protein K431DRAFT_294068 [Polychaeton citri CBS 116435]|uniref:Uncharacterized protein n=1 Tax=Polychaeton citri CBS 116435 TaxID=1314669 RepID=A0A9P4Q6W0_9PEZI|nr:hypothetical protein K431DRAFT_294068 [Polychaeton citri CBS 116435]